MPTLTADTEGVPPVVTTTYDDFDSFFSETWPRMFRVAYAMTGDAGSAEDSLQSAYARAFSLWHRVSRADQPDAYLRRMVVNEVIGSRRYGWGRRERPHEHIRSTDAVASPEDAVVSRDHLWTAVQTLPPRQRAVVVLRYYEDLSETEIAGVLGCSRGTVKSQASKALDNLRRTGGLHLTQNGDEA